MVTLDTLKPGDVVSYLYDTGAMGYTTCFARVTKVCTKQIRCRFENGREALKYPGFFQRVMSAETVVRLREEGVKI